MTPWRTQIVIVLMLHMLCAVYGGKLAKWNSTVELASKREAKDLYHYGHGGEEANSPVPYPPSYYPRPEALPGFHGCPSNSMSDMVGRQLNFFLLKIGAIALVKAILAGLFLFKIPLFFLKMVFLKSFLFPVLIAPLLLHMFSPMTETMMRPSEDEKPGEMNPGSGGMGRILNEDLSTRMWRSLKVFTESEQCLERFACVVGAYNGESSAGKTFGRALKLFEKASPSNMQRKMSSVREAYKSGAQNGFCSEKSFVCHGPRLILQHGAEKMQLL